MRYYQDETPSHRPAAQEKGRGDPGTVALDPPFPPLVLHALRSQQPAMIITRGGEGAFPFPTYPRAGNECESLSVFIYSITCSDSVSLDFSDEEGLFVARYLGHQLVAKIT